MVLHFILALMPFIIKSFRDGHTKAQWIFVSFFYSGDAEVNETNKPCWCCQPNWKDAGEPDEANPIRDINQLCV